MSTKQRAKLANAAMANKMRDNSGWQRTVSIVSTIRGVNDAAVIMPVGSQLASCFCAPRGIN